jgi:serine/threonine protein kinase/Tol biopolymer transport system component
MALASGAKLGPYEIVAPLGAGGMGEVYRARDTRLNRIVAIKILPAHLSDNPEAKQRIDREARAISSLNHPNICTLHDVGHQDGIDYLVMEFLDGETLAQRLAKGPLPPEQVLKYGIEICAGLEKAHKSGVVHRDLKPGNVMLTKSGAKLMDFGLAKATAAGAPPASSLTMTLSGPSADQPLTEKGTVVGTFQYMSPEQIEGKDTDARSDIFALGAVLYEMATRRRAFAGKTQGSIVAAILAAEPQPISAIQPMSPPALDRVVKGCLAKDPEERLQTAHDVKLQLKWIAEGGSQAGIPAPLASQRKTRERILWAASALLMAVSLGLAVIHFGGAKSGRQVIHAYIPPPEKSTFAFVGDRTGPVMVSPDGTRLVFAAFGPDGKQMLWLRPLDASSSQPLPGTEDAAYPFWSPDSRFIGFFAERKLKMIEATGGPAQALCDALDGRGGSWNREGIIVFPPTFNGPLYKISSGGGTPTPVTELDSSQREDSHRWPQFLPDGRHFLFFGRSRQAATSGAYVGSLDSKEKKLLFRNPSSVVYAAPGYLLFVRENTLMAQAFDHNRLSLIGDGAPIAQGILVNAPYQRSILSVSDNGVLAYGGARSAAEPSRLRWLDRSGKQISTVGDPGMYANPRLSPDGTKLAVAITDATRAATDIWIYHLTHGGKTRLTFDASLNLSPIWSPDGGQVVFSSNRRNGFPQLYRKAANGEGGDESLLDSNTTDRPDDWSPDGRFILYEPNPTVGELWLLPLSGDRKPAVLLSGEGGIFPAEGTFSHDGKWLAFSEYSAGKREVYITSYPGRTGKWQVSVAGGRYPRWRHDGSELFFLGADNATMMAVDLDLKKAVPRIGIPKALFPVHFALVPYQNRMGAWDPFEVAADGKRFLVNSPDQLQAAEPINVIVNWDEEFKKQRP